MIKININRVGIFPLSVTNIPNLIASAMCERHDTREQALVKTQIGMNNSYCSN